MSNAMQGRTAVVFGSPTSAASRVDRAKAAAAGAKLAVTYQNERLKEEADDLIKSLPGAAAFMGDVSAMSRSFPIRNPERKVWNAAYSGAQRCVCLQRMN